MLIHADKKRARGRRRQGGGRGTDKGGHTCFKATLTLHGQKLLAGQLNILSTQTGGVSRGSWERLLSRPCTHPYHSPIPHVSTPMPSYYVLPALHCQASLLAVSAACPATMCSHMWRFFYAPGLRFRVYDHFIFHWVSHAQPRNHSYFLFHTTQWTMHCSSPRQTHPIGNMRVTVSNQLETKSTVTLHDCGLLNW